MPAFESQQVRLRIVSPTFKMHVDEIAEEVTGKDILGQMRKNGVFKNDKEGKYVEILFDAQPFRFREGKIITVGETIANALRRNSIICVGSDRLNGPMVPFLEVVEKYALGDESKPNTSCPVCGIDQKSLPALARHLGQERKKHPELFVEEKTGYEAPDQEEVEEEVEAEQR